MNVFTTIYQHPCLPHLNWYQLAYWPLFTVFPIHSLYLTFDQMSALSIYLNVDFNGMNGSGITQNLHFHLLLLPISIHYLLINACCYFTFVNTRIAQHNSQIKKYAAHFFERCVNDRNYVRRHFVDMLECQITIYKMIVTWNLLEGRSNILRSCAASKTISSVSTAMYQISDNRLKMKTRNSKTSQRKKSYYFQFSINFENIFITELAKCF